MEVSVSRGEATEAELDRLIEKRAALEDPEAKEALWQRSVRAHHERIRRQNRALWFAYFCSQAQAHAAIAADYERRAEELCSEAMEGE